MDSTRAYSLSQIIKIEDRITQLSKSSRYRKVQEYTRILRGSTGSSLVMVEDPLNMGDIMPVRRNSELGKQYLESYETFLKEYEDMFDKLNKLKKRYTNELF